MLRVVVKALTRINPAAILSTRLPVTYQLAQQTQYHILSPTHPSQPLIPPQFQPTLLKNAEILKISQNIRPLTKFSLKKGKRKTVKAVLKRFYRLDWGAWIRTKAGRHKKLWKKSESRKRRLRQHVFTNATQSWLLDKMVTKCWRKPKHYIEDPYEPYHIRDEFFITRKKPL